MDIPWSNKAGRQTTPRRFRHLSPSQFQNRLVLTTLMSWLPWSDCSPNPLSAMSLSNGHRFDRSITAMRPEHALGPKTHLLSLNEVADYLSVSIRTVRRLIDDKQLRCIQVGRQKRIDPKDLEAYLKANKT